MRKLLMIIKLWRTITKHTYQSTEATAIEEWLGCSVDTFLIRMTAFDVEAIQAASRHLADEVTIEGNQLLESLKDADSKRKAIEADAAKMQHVIKLTSAESMNNNRLTWAETLISQIAPTHDGRNSWLLNYGVGKEAEEIREQNSAKWDSSTQSAELRGAGLRHSAS